MKKILFSTILALTMVVTQMGTAFAQSGTPTPPITGTVQSVTLETDSAGVTTAVVTLTDSTGATQTVRLSLDTATSLGLVTTDPTTGEPVVDSTVVGTDVSIDPTTVISDTTSEEPQHPVGSALADFFGSLLGVDYDSIMSYHDDGVGFGVIAQALWMTKELGGDTSTFDAIINAKQTGDYSAVTLPDGSTPTNWGQFRKAVLGNGNAKKNLGSIMSGHANSGDTSTESSTNDTNGGDHGKSGNHGKSGGSHGKGNGKP